MNTENSRNEVPRDRLGGHSDCTLGRRRYRYCNFDARADDFRFGRQYGVSALAGNSRTHNDENLNSLSPSHEGETVRSEDVRQNP